MKDVKIDLTKYDVIFKKDENDIQLSVYHGTVYYRCFLSDEEINKLIILLQSVKTSK